VSVGLPVGPSAEARVEWSYEDAGGQRLLRQVWHTPAATLTERLRVTDDWPQAQHPPVWLGDDFRTPRYVEYPFKQEADLAALPYLFALRGPAHEAALLASHAERRALAEEFQVPLLAVSSAGLDWLLWLYPAQEAVLRTVEQPEYVARLTDHINGAHLGWLELALELGVEGVVRRGWYESCDFRSPTLYHRFARPALERECAAARDGGAVSIYLMDSGIMPLLGELGDTNFDCLHGADPATSHQDLAAIRRALPGKSLWGGLSGPLHLGLGTPQATEAAVEKAFAECGRGGFLLGTAVGFRHTWPWENLQAAERAWLRLR